MNHKKLSLFQTFNVMRIFLSLYYEQTHTNNVGMLLGGLRLFKDRQDWRENPETWDPPAWDDWMDGVFKTLQDLNITENPKLVMYNDKIIFLCIKNYLQLLYDQFSFSDIGVILTNLEKAQHIASDPLWQQLQKSIKYSVDETYLLDQPLK